MDSHTHSGQVQRLSVIENGRRRRWTADEKMRIVMESASGPRLISATARRHQISNAQLYAWRRSFGFSARESGGQSGQGLPFSEQSAFLPVSVKADGSGGNIAPDLVLMHGGVGRVEIELRCGRIVRVDAEINPDALARVLAVVDRSQ